MTVATLHNELDIISRRTRRSLVVSVGVHALLFLWLGLSHHLAPEEPTITEITWIEPQPPQPPSLPAAVARSTPAPRARVIDTPAPAKKELKYVRETPVADVAPSPQELKAVEDLLSSRLTALQKETVKKPSSIAALKTPSPVGRPKLAGSAAEASPEARPSELTRKESTPSAPIALRRSQTRVQKAAVPTMLPDMQVDRARPDKIESETRRTLAGAQMTGPVADRSVVSYHTPAYPEWAKTEGVEGSVLIYFIVLPDGKVKENVMVQKTSGFSDFDDNAIQAILAWRFEPLARGSTGEQWGTIMFHYRLSDSP